MNRHQLMNIEEFCNTFGYNPDDLQHSYKLLANYSILANIYSHDTITCDVQDSMADIEINGVLMDGFAILLDGQILNSKKAIEDIYRVNDNVISEIVIIKSILKGFSDEILEQYVRSIKKVFSVVLDDVDVSKKASQFQSSDLVSCLYDQCIKTSNSLPKLNIYLVADDFKNNDDKTHVEEKLNKIFNSGSDNDSFTAIIGYAFDTSQLLKAYSRTKIRDSVVVEPYKNTIPLPSIHGIKDALVAVISFSEFKKLLIGEKGNIKTSIFHDNIRAFQGRNSVSKQMSETLKSGNFDQFIAMNNGITIIVSELNHNQGGKLELVDYQIVNGCQTCHVLYDNRDLSGIDKLQLLVKIICSTDENVRNSVIMGTNSQIEVKREQLIALTGLQERIEDYYSKIRTNSKYGFEPLYYERRSKQYVTETKVPQNKVITIPIEIMSFGAIFLSSPHYVSGYYSQIIDNLKNKGRGIFSDVYRVDPYYTSGLMFYKLSQLFSNNIISSKYKRLKYQILYAARLVAEISYREMPELDSPEIEKYCEHLNKLFCNDSSCRSCFKQAVDVISSVVDNNLSDSTSQNKEVTENIATKIEEFKNVAKRSRSIIAQNLIMSNLSKFLNNGDEAFIETDTVPLAIATLEKMIEKAQSEILFIVGRILGLQSNNEKIVASISRFLENNGKVTIVFYGKKDGIGKSSLLSRLALLKSQGRNVSVVYLSSTPYVEYSGKHVTFNMYAFDQKSVRLEMEPNFYRGKIWLNSEDIVKKYKDEVESCMKNNGVELDLVNEFDYQ